jgi:predicted branched-subunit amino acid permease
MRSFWRTLDQLPRRGAGTGRLLRGLGWDRPFRRSTGLGRLLPHGTGLDRALLRDIGLVVLADGVVGVSFGAIAVSGGQPTWVPLAMSPTVFAGGAQFAALYIVLGGGGLTAAVIAGLVLNARLLPFGFAVADVLDLRWPAKLLGGHLVLDESVAFALAQRDPARRRAAFFTCGALLFVVWNLGTLLGVLAGRAVGNPDALGLDAASPMVLLALVLPVLRDPRARRAALLGAAIAVASTPFLPGGLPVLLALFGLVVVARPGAGQPGAGQPGGGRPGADGRIRSRAEGPA